LKATRAQQEEREYGHEAGYQDVAKRHMLAGNKIPGLVGKT
jgi:hypothetical protein